MDLEKSMLFNSWLKPNNIQLKSFNHVAQAPAILDLVASGFGVGIVARWTADKAIREGRIQARQIGSDGFPVNWRAIHLGNQSLTFIEPFINLIREEAQLRRYTALF